MFCDVLDCRQLKVLIKALVVELPNDCSLDELIDLREIANPSIGVEFTLNFNSQLIAVAMRILALAIYLAAQLMCRFKVEMSTNSSFHRYSTVVCLSFFQIWCLLVHLLVPIEPKKPRRIAASVIPAHLNGTQLSSLFPAGEKSMVLEFQNRRNLLLDHSWSMRQWSRGLRILLLEPDLNLETESVFTPDGKVKELPYMAGATDSHNAISEKCTIAIHCLADDNSLKVCRVRTDDAN